MTFHTRAWKEKELAQLKELIKSNPGGGVVAVIDLNLLPAALFSTIRKKLSKKAKFKVSKTKVIRKAFADLGQKNPLESFVSKSCALVFTDMNPFELFSFLKKNKGRIAAKTGQIAGDDIMIPAGDTGLPPGPALSDLKAAGLEVRVQGQTIAITKDKVVTKKGEPVSKAVAGTLSKLDIKPITVGLKLVAAIEKGQLFESGVLDIDTQKVFDDFAHAYTHAFNLAFNSEYFTEKTTPLLLIKAFNAAKAVALEFEIFTPQIMPLLLAKAARAANALKENLPAEAITQVAAETIEQVAAETIEQVAAETSEKEGA